MLIFDSKVHFNNLIQNGFEQYPNKRDLIILSKYWLLNGVVSHETLKENLISFCKKWNTQFNFTKSEDLILKVIETVKSNEIMMPEDYYCKNIKFSKKEVKFLNKIENYQYLAVLFVLMTLCKWYKTPFVYLNSNSSVHISDIFAFAGVKKSRLEQLQILHWLNENNYINIQLKPLLKCNVLILDDVGEANIQFEIDDKMIKNLDKIIEK